VVLVALVVVVVVAVVIIAGVVLKRVHLLLTVLAALGCVHINMSTSLALYGFPV